MTAQGGDLLAWITDAITKADQKADRWHHAECSWHAATVVDLIVLHAGGTLCDCEGPATARRRCAADRKLLSIHQQDGSYCTVCTGEETFDDDSDGNREFSRPAEAFPCETVLALAEGYGWTEGER